MPAEVVVLGERQRLADVIVVVKFLVKPSMMSSESAIGVLQAITEAGLAYEVAFFAESDCAQSRVPGFDGPTTMSGTLRPEWQPIENTRPPSACPRQRRPL